MSYSAIEIIAELPIKIVKHRIFNSKAKCISFDLYDTVIWRRRISSRELQQLAMDYTVNLIWRLNSSIVDDRNDYETLRKSAFRDVKFARGDPLSEATLSEVYLRIYHSLGLEDEYLQKATELSVNFESLLEKKAVEAIPRMKSLMTTLKDAGFNLIIISDMYLSKKTIEEILLSADLFHIVDEVFISSEYGKRKLGGGLYRIVLETMNERVSSGILHIGDKFVSDILWARKSGFNSALWLPKLFNKRTPLVHQKADCLATQVVLFQTAFLYYVAEKVIHLRATKLCFIARDAIGLYELTNELLTKSAIFRAMLNSVDVKLLEINRSTTVFLELLDSEGGTEQVLAKFLSINRDGYYLEELQEFLSIEKHYFSDTQKLIIDADDCRRVAKELKGSALSKRLTKAAHAHAQRTLEYAEQEGLLNTAERVIWVDLGYRGTALRELEKATWDSATKLNRLAQIFSVFLINGNGINGMGFTSVNIDHSLLIEKELPGLLRINYSWLEIWFQQDLEPVRDYHVVDNRIVPKRSAHETDTDFSLAGRRPILSDSNVELDNFLSHKHRKRTCKRFISTMAKPSLADVEFVANKQYRFGPRDSFQKKIVSPAKKFSTPFAPSRIRDISAEEIWMPGTLTSQGKSWLIPIIEIYVRVAFVALNVIKKIP